MPIALAIAGLLCIGLGTFLLRSLGERFRLGRLLAAAPRATVQEAIDLATGPDDRYVAVHGRIESEEEFPDEHDRPLVFRRIRLQRGDRRGPTRWVSISDDRTAVPFGLSERSRQIDVDVEALGDGLIVIPRESIGTAGDLQAASAVAIPDLPSEMVAALAPDLPIRLIVDQISAVEQATIVGVPTMRPGGPMLTAGLGRPLIVSMLEPSHAMRLLSADHRRRVLGGGAAILIGICLLVIALVAFLLRL